MSAVGGGRGRLNLHARPLLLVAESHTETRARLEYGRTLGVMSATNRGHARLRNGQGSEL